MQPLLRVVFSWSFYSSLLHFTFCLLEMYQDLSVVHDFHNLLALIGIHFGISTLWLKMISKGTDSKYVFLVCHLELKIPVDFSIQYSHRKQKTKANLTVHRCNIQDFNFSWEITKDLGCSNFWWESNTCLMELIWGLNEIMNVKIPCKV